VADLIAESSDENRTEFDDANSMKVSHY